MLHHIKFNTIGISIKNCYILELFAKYINGDFMLIGLIRAIILYVAIIIFMRILGKRQIGELQPTELVITILISEILAIPMQDTKLPLLNTFIPVFLLIGFEILISSISLKSMKFRTLLQGNPVTVIRDGKLDFTQLKNIRFSIDDLLEELRKKDVFDISTVQTAVVETDGALSVMKKVDYDTVKNKDMKIKKPENTFPSVVISDGNIISKNLSECNTDLKTFHSFLTSRNINPKDIVLMTLDINGKISIIRKDDCL